MLIRCRGYNNGVKEYLEEGIKNGREFTRDELDKRLIIDGDLELTKIIYQNILDKGQDRYLTYTLSFREDEINEDDLFNITKEFKSFLMNAYQDDEFNFYAEAHIPKIKYISNKKTGEQIERKPHIHIIIPKVNLLSGKEANPAGMYKTNEKYIEAFQEYINQKYKLASPRDHIRFNPTDSANILSRYKGDDFYDKNRGVKTKIIQAVIDRNITNQKDFYQLVREYGETKIRNKGKDSEYIAVKLPDDVKYTNLKETIFSNDFIINRQLKKPPLDKKIINERLLTWPQRAREIKYVSKAAKHFREMYKSANPERRQQLLIEKENQFYAKYRGLNELHTTERSRDYQRGIAKGERRMFTRITDSLQNLRNGNMATDGESRESKHPLLLQNNSHVCMGQQNTGGNSRLRYVIPNGRTNRSNDNKLNTNRFTTIPSSSIRRNRGTTRINLKKTSNNGGSGKNNVIPVYARSPYRVASIKDIEKRGQYLFSEFNNETTVITPLKITLKPIKAININLQTSTVVTNLLQRFEQNKLLPSQLSAIHQIEKKFFSLRRNIFSDARLTRNEKTQFISILTFEQLKAKEAIKTLNYNYEDLLMGSHEIRNLLKKTTEYLSENSISSGEESTKPTRARERLIKLLERLQYKGNIPSTKNKQRQITFNDLYTKRARLSQHVHYIDKKSDKTMFVDTGKSIAMCKNGMTVESITIALQLAKDKFGSTLTIKGSSEFKNQVIDAVILDGMHIHFTDKKMNKQLEERIAELNIVLENGNNTIEKPNLKEQYDYKQPIKNDHMQPIKNTQVKQNLHQGILIKHGAAPYLYDVKNSESYFVDLKLTNGSKEETKTYWGVTFKEAFEASQARTGDTIQLHDHGTEIVQVPERQDDGSIIEVPRERRLWSVEIIEAIEEAKEVNEETTQIQTC